MRNAAVTGHPIGHSKSPLIHGYWLKQHGIEGSYIAQDVPPETAKASTALWLSTALSAAT